MMTVDSEVRDLLRDWEKVPRPLKDKTKEELFKYTEENPSEAAEWAFTKELLARELVFMELRREVQGAEFNLEFCQNRKADTHAARRAIEAKSDQAQAKGNSEAMNHAALALRDSLQAEKVAEDNWTRGKVRLDSAKAVLAGISTRNDAISPEEVQAFYRTQNFPKWQAISNQWRDMCFLNAQRFGWTSFLMCEKKLRIADCGAWDYARKTAFLVGESESDLMKKIGALYQSRVAPTIPERQKFLDDGGIRFDLKDDDKKQYWRWWRAYNTATLKNGWADDSGVAYDERAFNLNSKSEGEA